MRSRRPRLVGVCADVALGFRDQLLTYEMAGSSAGRALAVIVEPIDVRAAEENRRRG